MTARPVKLRCLSCGHEYNGFYDPDNVTERTCPQCRSNSIRRLPVQKEKKK